MYSHLIKMLRHNFRNGECAIVSNPLFCSFANSIIKQRPEATPASLEKVCGTARTRCRHNFKQKEAAYNALYI